MRLLTYITVAALVVLFYVGVILSPLALLFAPKRASRIFQATNRLCGAAYLGFDGKQTISASCGNALRSDPACQPCKAICAGLNVLLNPRHCELEASDEAQSTNE